MNQNSNIKIFLDPVKITERKSIDGKLNLNSKDDLYKVILKDVTKFSNLLI